MVGVHHVENGLHGLAPHELGTGGAGFHVAMGARQVAELAHVHLHRFRFAIGAQLRGFQHVLEVHQLCEDGVHVVAAAFAAYGAGFAAERVAHVKTAEQGLGNARPVAVHDAPAVRYRSRAERFPQVVEPGQVSIVVVAHRYRVDVQLAHARAEHRLVRWRRGDAREDAEALAFEVRQAGGAVVDHQPVLEFDADRCARVGRRKHADAGAAHELGQLVLAQRVLQRVARAVPAAD